MQRGRNSATSSFPSRYPAQENYERVILDSRYNPTFQVLQALKSHDEDFYDTINQVDLRENKKITVAIFTDDSTVKGDATKKDGGGNGEIQAPLNLEVTGKIREALFARIVDSLTDKHYYTKWAEETARINAQYEERIRGLLETDHDGVKKDFQDFHSALKRELNDGIAEEKAISLLAQHLVTRPVFDALFSEFQFARHNPVAQAMERIIERLRFEYGTDTETKELKGFLQKHPAPDPIRGHHRKEATNHSRPVWNIFREGPAKRSRFHGDGLHASRGRSTTSLGRLKTFSSVNSEQASVLKEST